jgi:dynein assembly factor 5
LWLQVEHSAELIGYFVEPNVWMKLVLKGLRMSQSHGNILVIGAIIRGSQASLLLPHLDDLCQAVSSPDVCHTVMVRAHQVL